MAHCVGFVCQNLFAGNNLYETKQLCQRYLFFDNFLRTLKSVVPFNNVVTCLKGSYDVAKKNIILCIWCNAMCLCGLRFKNTLFSTYCTLLLLLYAPPF